MQELQHTTTAYKKDSVVIPYPSPLLPHPFPSLPVSSFDFMARMNDAKLFECRQHIINVLRFPCRDIAMALGLEVRQGAMHVLQVSGA